MFGKKSCYLCGGNLVNGRCVECGLDNERNAQKKYRLNESSRDRKIRIQYENARHEKLKTDTLRKEANHAGTTQEKSTGSPRTAKATAFAGNGADREGNPLEKIQAQAGSAVRQISAPVKSSWNTEKKRSAGRTGHTSMSGSKSSSGTAKKGITLAAAVSVIAVILGGISSIVSDFSSEDEWTWDEIGWEDDNTEYEYDPYEYVEAELSETGEVYDVELTSGEYVVGVHLPEGNYSASLNDGTGYINVTDDENGIYLYQSFGYDEEYDEVTEMDDIRLFDGAILNFSGDGSLSFHTDTAQTQDMRSEPNPLTESVQLSTGGVYVAGEDFPEGVYDVQANEWTTVEYNLYLGEIYEDEELNYWQNSLWFSDDDGEDSFCNVVLPAGTEISTDTAAVTPVPSEVIGSTDYDSYYDRYR